MEPRSRPMVVRALAAILLAAGVAGCSGTIAAGDSSNRDGGRVLPVDAGPARDTAPSTDAEPASDAAPSTDAEPAGDAAPSTDAEPARDTAPSTDAEPATDASPPVDAADGAPVSTIEVAGPSAAFFTSHPYYTCVTNRYVATAANGGSDSNDGTSPTAGGGHGPWLTLQHASSSIPNPAPGYCINIGDGTYAIDSDIGIDRGGNLASMTGFTVWRAMNLLGARLVSTSNTWAMINVFAPYVIFDGLELDGGHLANGATGIGACAYHDLHHLFVLNSYIHDMGGNGVGFCFAEHYRVIHNRLDRNAYSSWNSGVSIYEPTEISGYTPTAYDDQWTPYHNVIAFNRASGNFTSPAGSPHTDGNGIEYDDTQHQQNAPNVVYAPKALILGNIAWGNGGFGIHIGPTSANADVFNNTCYNNGLDTLNTGTWRGEISSAIGSHNTYKNNIGYAVVGSGILANNTPFLGGSPVDATNSWSNNIAFGNAPSMDAPDAFPTPANKASTDPQLVDVAAANFALQPGSPAIGFGAVVPYWPQQTPGAVDVGACPSGVATCP